MKLKPLCLLLALAAFNAHAADSTLDAAIGGGLGGAAGAAIGHEAGGRDGAILGGALGAAVGTAIATDEQSGRSYQPKEARDAEVRGGHPHEYHCPPGQRKKGRC